MDKDQIIATKHWHVDNGGFTISVDKFGNMELDFGFLGYAHTTVFMSSQGDFRPKEVSDFLAKAAFEVEKSNEKDPDFR